MLQKVTALLIIVLLVGFSTSFAQDNLQPQQNVVITGEEVRNLSQNPVIETSGKITYDVISSGGLVWDMHPITDRRTGYDLMSNASTQQVWLDLNNPSFLHSVFTNSQVADGTWADRTCLYFGSTDAGVTWFELGGVPVNNGTDGRSGFPAIVGTSTGAAVIANHNNSNGTTTHSKLFIDNSPFEYNFTEHDPGVPPEGNVIWPRLGIDATDKTYIVSSINGGSGLYTNNFSAGVFAGWTLWPNGDQAETHAFAVSDGGKVGFMYIGGAGADANDVFYTESTDQGATWSNEVKIWDAAAVTTDSSLGCLRGGSVSFYGEEPCVVFELSWNTAAGYFPTLPSEIRFWSPNINGGVAKVLADSSIIPYYQNYGVFDVQYPICRPVIGRSEMHDYLFVAYIATTGEYWAGLTSIDSTAYYAGWFDYSTDGGDTWTGPERFTPDTPLMDYRYPSIVPVSPVSTVDEDVVNVHIVMLTDSIPGSTVNAAPPMPVGVTAQYVHFTTDVAVVNTDPDPFVVNEFNLEQNYPNPFNPNTSINYSLADRSDVSLKVYDVLGNEIATLVNTTQEAGSHSVNFDASNLASGLYIYTINAGSFTSSKKMMLLK